MTAGPSVRTSTPSSLLPGYITRLTTLTVPSASAVARAKVRSSSVTIWVPSSSGMP